MLFSKNQFCSVSVWDLLCLTLWVFWSEILLDVRHCVYWILAEIWAPYSSHMIGNKFFSDHCQGWKEGSFVCETVWFFVGEYLSVWPEICRVLSQIQCRFLREISGKKIFRENFSEFFVQTKASLKLVKFRHTFYNFYSVSVFCEKIHASTFICSLHLGKEARP